MICIGIRKNLSQVSLAPEYPGVNGARFPWRQDALACVSRAVCRALSPLQSGQKLQVLPEAPSDRPAPELVAWRGTTSTCSDHESEGDFARCEGDVKAGEEGTQLRGTSSQGQPLMRPHSIFLKRDTIKL